MIVLALAGATRAGVPVRALGSSGCPSPSDLAAAQRVQDELQQSLRRIHLGRLSLVLQ